MRITEEIDDIYMRYLLYGMDFKMLAKCSKKTLPTLRKYVVIKEGLDIFLYPLLGTKELTMDIALTLCKNVLNPHIQSNVHPSLKGLKTKEKKELIPTFRQCDICAGVSTGKEIMVCCENTLCIKCMISIIEESLNGVCLKEICCPFCREILPDKYLREILLMKTLHRATGGKKTYVEPWRNKNEYDSLQYIKGTFYLQNLFRKYRQIQRKLVEKGDEQTRETHHFGFCNGCIRNYFYEKKHFMFAHKHRMIPNLPYLNIASVEKDCANDMELKEEMFMCPPCKEKEENVVIKSCPHCGIKTIQPDGCNYVRCRCKHFWCFICNHRLPGTTEGHNVHFYVGPGSGPYGDKCRISEDRKKDTHILEYCKCPDCQKRKGAPLCKEIDCIDSTSYRKEYTMSKEGSHFNTLCDACIN